jgi:hypothetical protein
MAQQKSGWKHQSGEFNAEMKDALQQQHNAAQFLALVGRHLVPQKSDDSNTNMQFIPESKFVLGNAMPEGLRLGLLLNELELVIINEKLETLSSISLAGRSQPKVFAELKKILHFEGAKTSTFINELHYELPDHPVQHSESFKKDAQSLAYNSLLRSNAELVLQEIAITMDEAEAVRIWPHHFDTGSFLPILFNKEGDLSKSIGIGWAIPDSMVDEPYFYISFWSADATEGMEELPALKSGKWMMPAWNGAILEHSDISESLSSDEQYKLVSDFFEKGIKLLKHSLSH